MKLKKIIIKIAVTLFFLLLTILPVVMMIGLSKSEMSKYTINSTYEFKETSYGEPKPVTRQNLKMYYKFSGTVTSNTYRYVSFSKITGISTVPLVSVGNEVFKNDILIKEGNKNIKSPCNGIIEQINLSSDCFIKIRSFDKLELSCVANISTIRKIKNCNRLHLHNGNRVNIKSISNTMIGNKGKIVFTIENANYMYGQKIKNLKLYTGEEYSNVLTIDKNCVYQKEKNGSYFVRIVDEEGYFENEQEVEIGLETDKVVSVLNIDEDTLCDSGYKELLDIQEE